LVGGWGDTNLWHVKTPGFVMLSTRYKLSCPWALGVMDMLRESSDGRVSCGFLLALPGLGKPRAMCDWGDAAKTAAGASPAPRRATR
jgi:hypothetical protein